MNAPKKLKEDQPEQLGDNKRPKCWVIIIVSSVPKKTFVLLNEIISIIRKPISIIINNALPCIDLFLDLMKDQNNFVKMIPELDAATPIREVKYITHGYDLVPRHCSGIYGMWI